MQKWTEQTAFNAVWAHFVIERNDPAMDEHGCVFIDDDGERCALGLLLDEQDAVVAEDEKWDVPAVAVALNMSHEQAILFALQGAHDGAAEDPALEFHAEIERRLRNVAAKFALEVPHV